MAHFILVSRDVRILQPALCLVQYSCCLGEYIGVYPNQGELFLRWKSLLFSYDSPLCIFDTAVGPYPFSEQGVVTS